MKYHDPCCRIWVRNICGEKCANTRVVHSGAEFREGGANEAESFLNEMMTFTFRLVFFLFRGTKNSLGMWG